MLHSPTSFLLLHRSRPVLLTPARSPRAHRMAFETHMRLLWNLQDLRLLASERLASRGSCKACLQPEDRLRVEL
jgi:hypothetical protein